VRNGRGELADDGELPLARELALDLPKLTIRALFNTYSVPSRLCGEQVVVRVYERTLEVWYRGVCQLSTERLLGRHGSRINYRHVVWSLVRKPGAFSRYRYREDLFPSLVFRRAYDAITQQSPDTRGDLEYLRILHLAAATSEADVEAAIEQALTSTRKLNAVLIKAMVQPAEQELPELAAYEVDLNDYDALIATEEVAS
jgi:hypothetical protein